MRTFTTQSGEIRRNPIRNQIDYIVVRQSQMPLINNARSYAGTQSESDHKLVKASMNIGKWTAMLQKANNTKTEKICISRLSHPEVKKQFFDNLKQETQEMQSDWNQIADACKKVAKEVAGIEKPHRKSENPLVKELSVKRNTLFLTINKLQNHSKHESKIQSIKKERRDIKKQIDNILKQEKESETAEDHKYLDSLKDDSTKYFQVYRKLQMKKPKQPLFVKSKDGYIPTTNNEKAEVIKEHFTKALAPEEMKDQVKKYPPTKLKKEITQEEVTKAVGSMKNGKSCGEDGIFVEMIKYAPNEIHQKIADILNKLHESVPEEIITGLLSALPKPGKVKGPPENLRPIILLSVLRKILTIIMLRRIWPKIKDHIPIDQAAYQGGRSTTEQVFSVKILCEKAIAAQDIQLALKLLDMSKAFDTISRLLLFIHLEEALDQDELYYLSILTNEPQLKIKVENTISSAFTTTAGIMQGDCLSAILFIFYLGKALSGSTIRIEADNQGTFFLEPKYADDITIATINDENSSIMKRVDEDYPARLKEYHLKQNESKTENHNVPPKKLILPPNPNTKRIIWSDLDWSLPETTTEKETWKTCKLLGSRLDSETDIKCRKAQACKTLSEMSNIFQSKHLSLQTKLKQFKTYIETIFLYNSELWSLTPSEDKKIDAFHRRLLRKAINKAWPKKQYTNIKLYEMTKAIPWSKVIKQRRLRWTGHLLRLDPRTPARIALNKFTESHKNKVGRPKNNWLSTIRRDLETYPKSKKLPKENSKLIEYLSEIASDRERWRAYITKKCGMVRKD